MTLGSGLNVAVVYAQLRYMDPASVNPLGASRYQELRRRRAHKSSLQHRHLCAPAPLFFLSATTTAVAVTAFTVAALPFDTSVLIRSAYTSVCGSFHRARTCGMQTHGVPFAPDPTRQSANRLRVPTVATNPAAQVPPPAPPQGPRHDTTVYQEARPAGDLRVPRETWNLQAGSLENTFNAGGAWQPLQSEAVGAPGTFFEPVSSAAARDIGFSNVRLRSDSAAYQQHGKNIYGQQYWNQMFGSGQALTSMVSQFARVAWMNMSGTSPQATQGASVSPDAGICPQSWAFYGIPKVYFQVDVGYVMRKLLILFFPFYHRSWSRKRKPIDPFVNPMDPDAAIQHTTQRLLPPSEDPNAPDLYIPAMSFVTYVLLVGLLRGAEGKFTPQAMGEWASMGLIVIVLEVLLIRVALFLAQGPSVPWFDLIAYSGYKFAGLAFATASTLLASRLTHGRTYVSLAVLLYVSLMMGLFLLRSFRRLLRSENPSGDMSTMAAYDPTSWDTQQARRNYVLLFIALLQIPIYLLLGVQTWRHL